MKALVLGARGAVGRVVTAELLGAGHDVVPAGRTAVPGGVRIGLPGKDGLVALRSAAAGVDVVVNASGIEDARIGQFVGETPLVEISATAAYLAQLREAGTNVLLGVGLVPGLSTLLLRALDTDPGDEVDLLVMLGSGEAHGPAAVAWTAGLIGSDVYEPAEGGTVRNLVSGRPGVGPDGRRRRYLRADFPDNSLTGGALLVRSYLTLSSPLATGALALVARVPMLRGAITRSPHLGSSYWHLVAENRRTGQTLALSGEGQSEITGLITALAAERVVAEGLTGTVPIDQILTLDEALRVRTPTGAPAVTPSFVPAPEVFDL